MTNLRVPALTAAAMLTLGALINPGCATIGAVNYPPVEGDTISHSVNNSPVPQLLISALSYAVRRYPPVNSPQPGVQYEQDFAINLPVGMQENSTRWIIGEVSPHAHPLTAATLDLPRYHVVGIRVRGGAATVDIIHPVYALSDPEAQPIYQGITLDCRGLDHPWTVVNVKPFPIGSPGLPADNVVPESWENPEQPRVVPR
ncbi:hypothetical protein BH11PLA1_BH11PLA1_21770 [soil metagenome]